MLSSIIGCSTGETTKGSHISLIDKDDLTDSTRPHEIRVSKSSLPTPPPST